jgi:glycerophosphoryl diester phosphodiesterase
MPGVRPANTWYDGHFEVPTLDEILVLVETLVATLRRHHLDRPNAPLFGQSFETGTLRTIASLASVPLVQLVDAEGAPYDRVASGDPRTHATLVSPTGLAEVAGYAMGIGVHTSLVCPHTAPTSGLVETAHAEGLVVHAWTVRDENCFLDPAYRIGDDPSARGDAAAQTRVLLDAGVDGIITDHPDTAVEARRQWLSRQELGLRADAAVG